MPLYLTRIEGPPPNNQKAVLRSGKIQHMPLYLTRIEGPPPNNQKAVLRSGKIQHMPLYLTRIEGPPPKRDVVRSSRARGAKFAVIRKNCGIFAV